MDAFDVSLKQESLVVKRRIAGTVQISTTPAVLLDTDKPTVVAVGRAAVKAAIETSNVRELARKNYIVVVL